MIYIGKQPLTADEAIDLFQGGLYEMLQKEFVLIEENIQRNKEQAAELKTLHKRYAEAGVKPLANYDTDQMRGEILDRMIAEGTTFDKGTLRRYGR
jgi:hypothetical protein